MHAADATDAIMSRLSREELQQVWSLWRKRKKKLHKKRREREREREREGRKEVSAEEKILERKILRERKAGENRQKAHTMKFFTA